MTSPCDRRHQDRLLVLVERVVEPVEAFALVLDRPLAHLLLLSKKGGGVMLAIGAGYGCGGRIGSTSSAASQIASSRPRRSAVASVDSSTAVGALSHPP